MDIPGGKTGAKKIFIFLKQHGVFCRIRIESKMKKETELRATGFIRNRMAQYILTLRGVSYMTSSIIALGDIVRETRKGRHMSQRELADKIGVCKRTIIDIETNIGNPKFEVLYRLIRELDLPLYQIFYPDIPENFEEKTVLLQEVSDCSTDELKILLPLIQSLKQILRTNEKKETEKRAAEKRMVKEEVVFQEIRI